MKSTMYEIKKSLKKIEYRPVNPDSNKTWSMRANHLNRVKHTQKKYKFAYSNEKSNEFSVLTSINVRLEYHLSEYAVSSTFCLQSTIKKLLSIVLSKKKTRRTDERRNLFSFDD